MHHESLGKDELQDLLIKAVTRAGNSSLMDENLVKIISEHSSGNVRSLMIMSNDLLLEGFKREENQLTEGLFLELFNNAKKGRR